MSQIEIADAATDLHGLIERARGGEDVVLSEGGRLLARLVPVEPGHVVRQPRQLGRAAGRFMVPEDFDAPLPDDVLELFEGRLFPPAPTGKINP